MTVIGFWGHFDGPDLGLRLFPRLARLELGRRVPRLDLRIWVPSSEPRSGMEPLGEWSEERLDELAASVETLVIVDGTGLGPFSSGLGRREVYVPTLRLTYDDVVAAMGLASRAFDKRALEARVNALRRIWSYPEDDALVVGNELGDAVAGQIDEICRRHRLERVTVASHGQDEERLVACIAWCGGYVGMSRVIHAVARSFARPAVLVDASAEPHVDSDFEEAMRTADRVREVFEGGDAVFDRIAALALRQVPPADPPDVDEAYAAATRALAVQLAAQREAFAERERALLDLIEGLTREINEKDIRFTRLWQKLHKADRLYNWHINRADFYEDLAIKRQDALDKLRLLGPLRSRVRRKIARTALGRFLAKVLRKLKGKPV